MKRYQNEGREHALFLLQTGRYDELAELLRESVVFARRHYDMEYEFFQNHGIGKMYKVDDASTAADK